MRIPEIFIRIAFLSFIIGTFAACTGSQKTSFDGTGNEAVNLFSNPSNVTWGGLYLGYKEGTHPVSLALVSDGENYKGLFKYQSSGETFEVEGPVLTDPTLVPSLVNPEDVLGTLSTKGSDGTIKVETFNGDVDITPDHPAHLKLYEYYNNTLSGDMHCVFTGDDILVYYGAADAQVGAYFALKKVKSLDEKNPFEGSLWTKAYDELPGKSETKARAIIARTGSGMSVVFYDKESKMRLSSDYDLRFDDMARALRCSLVDENDDQKASVICSFSPDWNALSMEYQKLDGESSSGKFQESMTLQFKPLAYLNYYSSADMDVPFAKGDPLFNQLMNDLASEWQARHNIYMDSVKKTGVDLYQPRHRFEFRSYMWNTISYLSKEMVSINLHRSSTHLGQEDMTINYNFKTHQVFTKDDVFRDGSGYEAFIADYLDRAIQDKPYAADPSFKKMMAGDPFKHMGITDSGIMFATDFNGLFGVVSVLVPFDRIQPFLNADGPLGSFYQN